MVRYELITDSTIELVTLDEAKLHCRVDNSADDSLITRLITSSRRYAEKYTNRAFTNQTWLASYDYDDITWYRRTFYLPYGNIQSITSVIFYHSDNTSTTIDPSRYYFLGNRLAMNSNYFFEGVTDFRDYDTMQITYVVGYGADATFVPEEIKEALLLLIAHWYENRGAIFEAIGGKSNLEILPLGATSILDAHRIIAV